jgi:arsenite methyltransferase
VIVDGVFYGGENMSSSDTLRPDYGVDAPGIVKGLWMGALACILLAFIVRLVGSAQHSTLVSSVFVCGTIIGGVLLGGAMAMLWSSKFGKLIERRRLIGSLELQTYETILDVGCGRGLLLTEAARYLESGKAIGVDLWQSRDQSGNAMEATIANARAESVADRVEVKTADMRSLPIEDESVDAAVSSLAIHNLPTREDRARAIEEISRVLKPGGRLALLDLAYSEEHMNTLRSLGWSHIERSGPVFLIYPPVRVVRGTKPGRP